MAATQVLTTPELLEQVFLRLPFLEVIRKQRVCRFWHLCIRDSIRVQRKLFMVPIEPGKVPRKRTYAKYTAQPIRVNPLLANVFRVRHSTISGSSISLQPPSGKRKLQQVNCKEDILGRRLQDKSLIDVANRPVIQDPSATRNGRTMSRQPQNARVQADNPPRQYVCEQWAATSLTQPPLPSVIVREKRTGKAVRVVAADDTAVTVGTLAKAAAEMFPFGLMVFDEYFFDAEMEIYQPLEKTQSADSSKSDGLRRMLVSETENIDLVRAWTTTLRLNLG